MTPCERMRPLIPRAVDGSLTAAEHAALDAHAASCAACRAAIAEQAEVRLLLSERAFDEAPAGFAARVRARVEPRAGLLDLLDLANWRAWTLRLAPAAAALWLLAWFPASGTAPTADLSTAIEAWASGGSSQSAGALVIDDRIDGEDLLAWALEAPSR